MRPEFQGLRHPTRSDSETCHCDLDWSIDTVMHVKMQMADLMTAQDGRMLLDQTHHLGIHEPNQVFIWM